MAKYTLEEFKEKWNDAKVRLQKTEKMKLLQDLEWDIHIRSNKGLPVQKEEELYCSVVADQYDW